MLKNINCQHFINEASDLVRDFQIKATEWLGRAVVVIKPALEKRLQLLQNTTVTDAVASLALIVYELVLFKCLDKLSKLLQYTLPGGSPLKEKVKSLADFVVAVSIIAGGIYGFVKVTNLPLQASTILDWTALSFVIYVRYSKD